MSRTAQHPVLQAPLAHAALGALAVAPLLLPVPTNANIVLTAVLTVCVGAAGSGVFHLWTAVRQPVAACPSVTLIPHHGWGMHLLNPLPRPPARCLWAAGGRSSRSRPRRR